MKKLLSFISITVLLTVVTSPRVSAIDESDAISTDITVDNNDSIIYSQLEISKEVANQISSLQSIENHNINDHGRSLLYTVKLEPIKTQTKSTGYKEASNQTLNGINFGHNGGSFGYKDGNTTRPVSMSFGISGFTTSFSVGVGSRQASGTNGYYINALPNKSLKLYVKKHVQVTTYKRYKIYTINGYKEPFGYVIGSPIVTGINFNVK